MVFFIKIVLTYCEKKKYSSNREKLLKAKGRKFSNFLRSIERFIKLEIFGFRNMQEKIEKILFR